MQEDYLIYVCRRREGKLGLLGATGRMRKGAGGCAEQRAVPHRSPRCLDDGDWMCA